MPSRFNAARFSPARLGASRHRRALLVIPTVAALAATALAGTGAQAATPPAPTYAVSTLPIAYAASLDVAPDGDLAGVAATQAANGANAGKPFVWTPATGLTLLPLPAGATSPLVVDITADGWVLGTATVGTSLERGLVWKPGVGGYQVLTIPDPAGRVRATPVAMDEQHRVVGSSGSPTNIFRTPFLWTEAGGTVDMVALGYPTDPPVTMSANGYVATATKSYRLGDPASVSALPALPAPYQLPNTYAIADDGDRFVIGLYPSSQFSARLFRLDAQTGAWTALWPTDMRSSFFGVSDPNALGDAVGYRFSGGEVSWSPGDPMASLAGFLAGGYAGVAGDLYPGLPIGRPYGISDGRTVATQALMGNNGGRLVLLTPTSPCTAGTCLRVASLTVAATNPSRCTGATRTATATVTVRNQAGAAVSGAAVSATLMTQNSTVRGTVLTGSNGVARISGRVGTCEGTVTALVEDVTKAGTGFDRSTGVLVRSVIPTIR